MKVLNLYAGIGGNRKLWEDVDVTAVEWDEVTAEVYQDYFPNDTVIVADAHQYLLDHYKEFDFIWSSPPCQTHSDINYVASAKGERRDAKYPDMSLYQEIILLDKWYDGRWIVENVKGYYKPLIHPTDVVDRHYVWSDFRVGKFELVKQTRIETSGYKDYEREYGYDLSEYGFDSYHRRQKLRNCVHPEIGKYILDRARDIVTKSDTEQTTLAL